MGYHLTRRGDGEYVWLANFVRKLSEDPKGMRVTSGTVKIRKDEGNLIGISIGGGAPNCPCLYVVQIFDNTPASRDGTLEAGDELISVNGKCCKGSTKVEVAKLIQSIKDEVTIGYNKLHAEPQRGKSLDIILKKLKHKMVESMSSTTADALGLSRAILCNDSLVKKLQELDRNEYIFKGLIGHLNFTIKSHLDMVQTYRDLGNVFSEIGAHEQQTDASKAFTKFGETHRCFEREGLVLVGELKPVMRDLNTYLSKAIPDSRLTIKKYADQKFEYLSYCLKVKEMDDEEYTYQALQEPLYRIETGNYEYRLILRCRQEARKRFAALRADVLVKLELLDQKHVQAVASQITAIVGALAKFNSACHSHLSGNRLFPIELDLSKTSCLRPATGSIDQIEHHQTGSNSISSIREYRDICESEPEEEEDEDEDEDDEVNEEETRKYREQDEEEEEDEDIEFANEATSLLTANERARWNAQVETSKNVHQQQHQQHQQQSNDLFASKIFDDNNDSGGDDNKLGAKSRAAPPPGDSADNKKVAKTSAQDMKDLQDIFRGIDLQMDSQNKNENGEKSENSGSTEASLLLF